MESSGCNQIRVGRFYLAPQAYRDSSKEKKEVFGTTEKRSKEARLHPRPCGKSSRKVTTTTRSRTTESKKKIDLLAKLNDEASPAAKQII